MNDHAMPHRLCDLTECRMAEATGLRPYTGCMTCGRVELLRSICITRGYHRWLCAACADLAAAGGLYREGGKTTCSAACGSGDGHIIRADRHSGG